MTCLFQETSFDSRCLVPPNKHGKDESSLWSLVRRRCLGVSADILGVKDQRVGSEVGRAEASVDFRKGSREGDPFLSVQ